MPTPSIRIVLVRPQGAANTGSVARVMKNMGLGDLVLVRPRFRGQSAAKAMAVHAGAVLESARTCETLTEAVADCGLVAGTASRSGPYCPINLTPRKAAAQLIRTASANTVALVFGPEDHGLSNKDLQLCQMLIRIPSHDDYASLNLAQAVAICCYELFLASSEGKQEELEVPVLATSADTELMHERLQDAFLSIGFLLRDNPDHIMYAVRNMLGRARLEERDVRILLGLARQIEWFGRRASKGSEPRTPNPEP
jgi:tRNA/rRNA methyltransferase